MSLERDSGKSMIPIILQGVTFAAILYIAYSTTMTKSQIPKLGYVDIARVLQSNEDAQAAKEKIRAQTLEWRKRIKDLEVDLSEMNKEILESGDSWDKETAAQKRKVFNEKQNEYIRTTQSINEQALQSEREVMRPVVQDQQRAIQEYAKKHQYRIIFGMLPGGNILYAENGANATDDFIKYVESKKGKKPEMKKEP